MAKHKQQKRCKKNSPKHARVSEVKNSPSLGVVASVALASTLAIAPFSSAQALETQASQPSPATDNASPSQSKAHVQINAPQPTIDVYGTQNSSSIVPHALAHSVTAKAPSPEEVRMAAAVTQTRAASPDDQSGAHAGSAQNTSPVPTNSSSSTPQPANGTKSTVITPNLNNPSASTQEEANNQVQREKDTTKIYTFKVNYCVEGYHQKQLLQPTEFTFTDDELTKISDPSGEGLYIPVVTTKGYQAQRGNYIKVDGKYVLDTQKDDSVQSYIKIDRQLVEAHVNTITSTDTNIISQYTVEYRPKTITYYVRHMIQDPNNPNQFNEYNGTGYTITVPDKQGGSQPVHVSKAKGVVGQNLYAQPITIEGYSPEVNLVNSPIPDDEDYADADADDPTSSNRPKKYLMLELRYLLNKHEVSYDTQGGTAIQAKTFRYGMQVDAVPEPKRKGYTFLGWTKELSTGTPATASGAHAPQTPDNSANASEITSMPDADVRFVAHWKIASQQAQYHINIWVQKADLPKPDDPTNMDNYDFIGMVTKQGTTNGTISQNDLNLTDDDVAKLAWPDASLRDRIGNKSDLARYFMEDATTEGLTNSLNVGEEPEYVGSKEMRPRTKIRPDGTTVVNKVFNRRVYELIFANPDIVNAGGTSKKLFSSVNHITITKGHKEYNDTDKDKLYKVTYRFGQTIHYTSDFPTDAETKRYATEDEDSRTFGLGWLVANDANEYFYVDTPPYRFDLNHFIAPQKDNKDFSQDNIRLFGEKLTPYQRVLVPDGSNNSAGSVHVLVKLETEESARRNDDSNREYVASELSYTKDDTVNSAYPYGAPTIEGFEPLEQTQSVATPREDDYYDKLADELADVWKKDHPEEEDDPDGSDDEFREWVEQKFPHLVFTSKGSDDSDLEENGLLIFKYKRKKAPVNFAVDEVTPIQEANDKAQALEPFATNIKKLGYQYDKAVTKQAPGAGKQFADTYSFKLNGKTYTFKRPDQIPYDYEFAGWSLDPSGTQKLTPLKSDGTPYTDAEFAELLTKSPEEIAKALGNIPLESAGITLYASWKRVDVIHTLDIDMNRDDAPAHTQVFVKHGEYAKKARTTAHDTDSTTQRDYFPAVAERQGYIFNGWLQKYTKADGSEQWLPFAFTSPILENLQIKAQWIEDKRVKGTVSHIFLREGYTVEQYKQAQQEHNNELLKKMVADQQDVTYANLRPRSSYAAEAAYRNGDYFPDHTYSTFVVSENEQDNHAEFIYTHYATRHYTVHYKDAAGNELATPETFVSNKLNYDVAHAKVIPGYRLPNSKALARQLHFVADEHGAYKNNYDVNFIYDDVRILKRTNASQVTPDNYSRLQFDTETTELSMESGKVKSTKSTVAGGDLAPFNGTNTGDTAHSTNTLTFDVVKGTKAYEAPLPIPHAKDGYTFTGWTSKVVFAKGETGVDGANRLPVFSEEFPYKVVYTAHFTKTQIAFVGGDSTAEAPEGYYKVTYSADQNGRLSRQISDGHGGTKTETLDTLTNVVVVDKYKDNVIEAPVAVPDKGFEEKGDFEFKGRDEKDRSYVKHFEMITPKAAEKRFVLPGKSVLHTNEPIKSLIANNDMYADTDDATTGAQAATYEFCDEHGNAATLDEVTPGEHKIFIKVTAGRAHSRVFKLVPFFYEVLPQMSFGEAFDAHKYSDSITRHYKKITFTSNKNEGELVGKDQAKTAGENKTLETYVYTGEKAPDSYQLDLPSALGKDYESAGYHYVFRGWRLVGAAGGAASASGAIDFKTFVPDIKPTERYHNIARPTSDIVLEAVYEKIPYITQKTDNGNVPPDSVVVSFQPAAGRTWSDGTTGPKVYYIKKGMDISKLDVNGVIIKEGEHRKSVLDALGEKLYGYDNGWSKSSMDGVAGDDTVGDKPGEWIANNAFQEFVAHQKDVITPELVDERVILTGGKLPDAKDFIKNLSALEKDNLKDENGDGKPDDDAITVEYLNTPRSDKAGTYIVPFKITVKHKDGEKPFEYRLNSVLKVMPRVLSPEKSQEYHNAVKEHEQNPGKELSPEAKLFKDHYADVTFEIKDGVGGNLVGVDGNELIRSVMKQTQSFNEDVKVSVPQVTALVNQTDSDGKKFDYKFIGWEIVNSQTGETIGRVPADGALDSSAAGSGAHIRKRRALLDAADGAIVADGTFTAGMDRAAGPQDARRNPQTIDISPDVRSILKKFPNAIRYRAVFEKVYHILDSSDVDTVPAGYVPVAVLPAPGHTWEDGSRDPYIKYVKSGSSIKDTIEQMQKQLSGFIAWTVYDSDSKELTNPADIADRNPTRARTFIARQSELPEITTKDDVTISAGDKLPSYKDLVGETQILDPTTGETKTINSLDAFTDKAINKRFAGWETPENGYESFDSSKPGTYTVRFGLNYYTDAWDMNANGTPKRDAHGNPLFKTQTKWVNVTVRVLPRVIAAQDMPDEHLVENQYIKQNYKRVTFMVAKHDHGALASAWNSYYVLKSIDVNPNERLERVNGVTQAAPQGASARDSVGAPLVIAKPGYIFSDWVSIPQRDGSIVYMAHFRKLPRLSATFSAQTYETKFFTSTLATDAQNPLEAKKGTIFGFAPGSPTYGLSVVNNNGEFNISGTPTVNDWKPGEQTRDVQLHFESRDKYGREGEFVVTVRITRNAATPSGSGGFWYPHDDRYDRLPDPAVSGDGSPEISGDGSPEISGDSSPEVSGDSSPEVADDSSVQSSAQRRGAARTSAEERFNGNQRSPRHAREPLPKTSDVSSHPLIELVAGSGIALIGTAFIAKRKQRKNKRTK